MNNYLTLGQEQYKCSFNKCTKDANVLKKCPKFYSPINTQKKNASSTKNKR